MASYPDPDLGIAMETEPVPWFSVDYGVYNGAPDAIRALISLDNGLRPSYV
jgi:hypothetical protein